MIKAIRNNTSSLIFLSGVIFVGLTSEHINSFAPKIYQDIGELGPNITPLPAAPRRALSTQDIENAQIAWRYFETYYRPETGFVDSVSGFPSTTLWDQGSYIFALLSARNLEIISNEKFDFRITSLLQSIRDLELFDRSLPNKVYNTITLKMVDYENNPKPDGVGWSALDVMRFLASLKALKTIYPQYGPAIDATLTNWSIDKMVGHGALIGATRLESEILYVQEGRLGYEQYAARIGALYGLDTLQAISARGVFSWKKLGEVPVPIDRRKFDLFDAITPISSEPFFLHALELGFSFENSIFASQVFLAQESRYQKEGVKTMVSEDHIDRAPFFLYSSVSDGETDWSVIADDGKKYLDLRTVSLKAAFAWDAIYDRSYTNDLLLSLSGLAGQDGWKAGVYEMNGTTNTAVTLNTNAVVLESLSFKKSGPLLSQSDIRI